MKLTITKRRTKLDHYSDAPYNPRDITPAALKHLGESERVFGDLSGFVVNKATGNVVCGHQRRAAFGSTTDIKWLSRVTCEVGPAEARFKSAERMGVVEAADGALFSVREVDWPEPFEKAANIAANNPAIQGDFTEALPSLIEALHVDFSDAFLESVGLGMLDTGVGWSSDIGDEPPHLDGLDETGTAHLTVTVREDDIDRAKQVIEESLSGGGFDGFVVS